MDALSVELHIILKNQHENDIQLEALDPYFDQALMRVVPSVVLRRRREAILNDHLIRLRTSELLDEAGLSQHLSLMIRLMSVSNATADIVSSQRMHWAGLYSLVAQSTDPKCLWDIAESLDRNGFADNKAIRTLFQELSKLTLRYGLAIVDSCSEC